jgi:hypothetical protein
MLDITIGAILTATVPDVFRARVCGAYSTINYGLRPVGAIAGGTLGATLGLRSTLWISTTAALLGVLWLLRSPLPRMRTLLTQETVAATLPVGAIPGVAQPETSGTKSAPTIS